MKSLLSTKMAEGTPMREHCLSMITLLNTLEVLGAEFDGESQVDMILQSLPNSFNQFKLNVSMSKKDYTLAKLMNELIAAKSILRSKVSVNYAHASNSKLRGIKKKKQENPASNSVTERLKDGKKERGKSSKNCYYCDKPRHWKKNCFKYLATKGKSNISSFLVETCLVVNPTDPWCVDS
jgi:hypothetical protein